MRSETNINVVIIAPVFPFRGGISQHSTMLKRALEKQTSTHTISFSRQYPAILYPGKSDRDPAYENHHEENTEYLIDSINPITWLRTINRIKQLNPTTLLVPWWTVFWAPCFGCITFLLNKKNINIAFFCHNVVEHESAKWKQVLTKMVLKNSSQFVVHTKEDENNLLHLIPDAQVTVHPHPIYDHFPAPEKTLKRRKKLELLFYGFIRPYKGLDDLIDAMALLKEEDIQLTIAGEFWNDSADTLQKIESLDLSRQIEVLPGYHSEQDTAELFARSDLVVLPYRSATGSGVVPIAYHYNKPVIVTDVGGLPDVVLDQKTGYIVPTQDIPALADSIKQFSEHMDNDWGGAVENYKQQFSWTSLAKTIVTNE